jgi:uncharacterized OsmC-like protein
MDSRELRAMQAPLKQKYREHPEKAMYTLRAQGTLGDDLTCHILTGESKPVAGQHPATGGSGEYACAAEMLLEALTACAGVTMNSVATAMGIDLRDAVVTAEGKVDFRGTLAVNKETPVGFQSIHLKFSLDTDAENEKIETLIRLTERYCIVFQSLSQHPEINVSFDVTRSGTKETGTVTK